MSFEVLGTVDTTFLVFRDALLCSLVHTQRQFVPSRCHIVSVKAKGKRKFHPRTGHECREGEQRYSPTLSLTSALDGEWVINATPRPLQPRERKPVPIVQEAKWEEEPVWKSAEIFAPTGIQCPYLSTPQRVAIRTTSSRPTRLQGKYFQFYTLTIEAGASSEAYVNFYLIQHCHCH